jgi:hypothetical protein
MSVMIGIDPHKALHAACVIDRHEVELPGGRVGRVHRYEHPLGVVAQPQLPALRR